MSVLSIKNLQYRIRPHFWLPFKTILKNISFAVEANEIFGCLGPNGAGKTTTIKAILGLVAFQKGQIHLWGHEARNIKIRKRIGYMPEHAYFPDLLSARELLWQHSLLAGLKSKQVKIRTDQVLELVGLKHAANERLRTYSKGMLQRVGLAQALIGDPDLVILDEPMSGLDPLGRRDIRQLMSNLREMNKTIFFSTHILPDVEMICDRIAIIVAGQTQQTGRLNDLLGGSIRQVEVISDLLPNQILQECRSFLVHSEIRGESQLSIASDIQNANLLMDHIRKHSITIKDVHVLRRSLEDLFFRATQNATQTKETSCTP